MDEGQQGAVPQSYQPVPTYQPAPSYYPGPASPFPDIARVIKALLWSSGFLSFMCMLFISTIIMLGMTPEIQEWILTPQPLASDPSVEALPRDVIFVIFPVPILLFELEGVGFQVWHLVLMGIFLTAFSYGLYTLLGSWLSGKGRALDSINFPERARSGMESVGKLFMATMSFSIIYFLILAAANVFPETPAFEDYSRTELLYSLFSASVFEELVSRLMLIGIPLLLFALVLKWERPHLRFLIGGGMRVNKVTLFLILFSAIIFAFAHVYSWDFWKVPQVFISGMALGYVFVRHGLFASILLHFSVNLSSSMLEIWPDNLLVISLLGFSFIIWFVAGSYFFFHYSRGLVKAIEKILYKPKPVRQPYVYPPPPPPSQMGHASQYPPVPHPPPPSSWGHTGQHPDAPHQPRPYGPPTGTAQGFWFTCRYCGNTSAKYENNSLICLRCGAIAGP